MAERYPQWWPFWRPTFVFHILKIFVFTHSRLKRNWTQEWFSPLYSPSWLPTFAHYLYFLEIFRTLMLSKNISRKLSGSFMSLQEYFSGNFQNLQARLRAKVGAAKMMAFMKEANICVLIFFWKNNGFFYFFNVFTHPMLMCNWTCKKNPLYIAFLKANVCISYFENFHVHSLEAETQLNARMIFSII